MGESEEETKESFMGESEEETKESFDDNTPGQEYKN